MSEQGPDGTGAHGAEQPEGQQPQPPSWQPAQSWQPTGQPSEPPVGAHPAFDVTPSADVIGGSDADRPTRGGRVPVVLAMVAVIALVLAGGAVALTRSSSSSASSSSLGKYVPADSYGYLQLDLRQSATGGLFDYLSHFPGSPATKPGASKSTLRDSLLAQVFKVDDQVDYATQVQPWLGNSAGVAMFRGGDGNPAALVILSTTDPAKAKASLAQIKAKDDSMAYEVVDKQVLLAPKQADIDAAQSQSKANGSLTSTKTYTSDIGTLPSGALLTGWADLGKITAAVKASMAKECATGQALGGGCSAFSSINSLGMLGVLGGSSSTTGRIALGVTVKSSVAQLTLRELGGKTSPSTPAVGGELANLPADTTGAIAMGGLGKGLASANGYLTKLESAFGTIFAARGSSATRSFSVGGSAEASAMAVPSAAVASSAISGDEAVPSGAAQASAALASIQAQLAAQASAQPSLPAEPSAGLQMLSDGQLDITKQIAAGVKAATGLTFPDDFETLLGDKTTIAVGDVPLSANDIKSLQLAIRTHPSDLAKAQGLAQTLVATTAKTGLPFQLGTATGGGELTLGTSQSYAQAVAAGGKLGDDAQFKATMGDVSGAQFAAYVDLSKFTGILKATKEKSLSGFKALGVVARNASGGPEVQLTLLAG